MAGASIQSDLHCIQSRDARYCIFADMMKLIVADRCRYRYQYICVWKQQQVSHLQGLYQIIISYIYQKRTC